MIANTDSVVRPEAPHGPAPHVAADAPHGLAPRVAPDAPTCPSLEATTPVRGGAPSELPYAHLNLTRNPFGALPLPDRAPIVVVDASRVAEILGWVQQGTADAGGQRAIGIQVLGPPGCGKTSLLLGLYAASPGARYYFAGDTRATADSRADAAPRLDKRVRAGVERIARLLGGSGVPLRLRRASLLLIDEANALPARRRARLFRRHTPIVIATTEDLSQELARHREVRTVRPAHRIEASTLGEIFRLRIEDARRAPGALPSVPHRTIARLRRDHARDVRAMEARLYDALQAMNEVGDIEVESAHSGTDPSVRTARKPAIVCT